MDSEGDSSMLSALILATAVQGSQTVTFSHPCAHSSVVLGALGEELGLILKPSGSVNNDYFLVRFDGVAVQTAFEKLAEYLNATWTQKEGVFYLGRTGTQDKRDEELGRERIKEAVEEYLTGAKRTHVWTAKEAAETLRPHILPNGSIDRSAVEKSLEANGPFRELLDVFVRTVGAKELSRLPSNRRTHYRWRPAEDERRIPPALRAHANQTIRSVLAFSQAFQRIGVWTLPGWDPVQAARIAKVDNFTPDVWSFSVKPMGTRLSVGVHGFGATAVWSSSITIETGADLRQISAIAGLDSPYTPSPFARAVTARLVNAATGTAHRLGKHDEHVEEIRAWFESGFETDPLHYLGGEALLQISEESGFIIVAVLPDSLISGFEASLSADRPLRDWLINLARKAIVEVDPVGGWIGVRPILGQGRKERFDRAKAAEFALRTYEEGWQRIDALADLTASCDGAYAFHYARGLSDVLQPVRSLGVRMIDPAMFRSLELYASLAPAARRAAKEEGVGWLLSEVPGPTHVRLNESVAFLDLLEPREDPSGHQWPFTLTLGTPTAVRTPIRLPAGAILEIRVEASLLFTNPDSKSGGGLSLGSLMTAEEAAERVYWALEPEALPAYSEQYTNLALVSAERLVIMLHLPDGTLLETKITIDARSPETSYLPIETLKGSEADAFREALRRLEGGLPRVASVRG